MPKKKSDPLPAPRRWNLPVSLLLRMFLLGSVSIAATAYAIYRHYYVPRPPMLVPAPSATEIPAPDFEPAPSR